MKILFWNIGKKITDEKIYIFDKVVNEQNADIVCIAEGTYSSDKGKYNCVSLNKFFANKNYTCYYNPLFVKDKKYKLDYAYVREGLKIYMKKNIILQDNFHWGMQREDGRIIAIKIKYNTKPYTFIFLHNYSKSGNKEQTIDQVEFISTLSNMIKLGKIAKDDETLIIIGDYNLEPWDTVLRNKRTINSYFINKQWNLISRAPSKINKYYNPIFEKIINDTNQNLAGTYSKNKEWALFDYILVRENISNINFEIIEETLNYKLLNSGSGIYKDFLNFGFDHLPIITKLNK